MVQGPEFDRLVLQFFGGHFLKMHVIWHETAKTNMSKGGAMARSRSRAWREEEAASEGRSTVRSAPVG